MIKHRQMMQLITNGAEFTCKYCKRTGELTDFVAIKKFVPQKGSDAGQPANQTKRRTGNNYESLIPFQMLNGKIRELYTRLIVQFNVEDVIL